jgi:hypothetical protein
MKSVVNTFLIDDLRKTGINYLDIQSVLKLQLIENTRHCWNDLCKELAFESTTFSSLKKGELFGKLCQILDLHHYYIKDIAILFNKS